MASQKNVYAEGLKLRFNELAVAYYKLVEYEKVYFDRGFNSGGADAIADADLDGSVAGDKNLNINANELGSGITLIQQLKNMIENVAVVQGDYETTLSTMRGDI